MAKTLCSQCRKPDLILGQGTRSCTPQLKTPHAATKTWHRPGDNVWIYCLKNISAQFKFTLVYSVCGLPWWLSGKECACNAGDASFIPG